MEVYWHPVRSPDSESCSVTLWDPMDYTVHGILQTRILEWVAFPFSRGSSQPRDWTQVSHIAGGFFTSWATREAQESWSGYPIPSPAGLPNLGIDQGLLHCRWTLYQLSYQGSPRSPAGLSKLSHTRYLLCVLKVEYSRTQTIWYAQCQDHELWSSYNFASLDRIFFLCIIRSPPFSSMTYFLCSVATLVCSFICLFVHSITYSTNTVEFFTYSIRCCAKEQRWKRQCTCFVPMKLSLCSAAIKVGALPLTVRGAFNFFYWLFGEGNGTPLQYSCLENPMHGGAW